MTTFIQIGLIIIAIDLFMTVFCQKPLVKPGRWATSMYPEMKGKEDEHGYL